jgi:hypothetical protein
MPHKPPTPPSPELIERIKQEVAAPGFLSSLTAWTDRQCGKLLSIEGRSEPGKASDLISSAVVATFDGVRRWDPEVKTFRRHCEQTINSLLWNECEKLRRRRHVTLDTASVDDSHDEAPSIDIEMSLRREDVRTRPDGLFAQREVRAQVFHALRSRTRADDAALRGFIDCHEMGHNREGEISARLGLTEASYRAVLARFHRLRAQMPEELRRNIRELMIQDGGPMVATVARRKGRLVEIVPDEVGADVSANDSGDSLDSSGASSAGDEGEYERDDRDAA